METDNSKIVITEKITEASVRRVKIKNVISKAAGRP